MGTLVTGIKNEHKPNQMLVLDERFFDVGAESRTKELNPLMVLSLVGGECSHHCAIPAINPATRTSVP